MLAKIQRDWISHTLLMGMQKGTATLKNSLAAFPKTKHALRAHYLAIIFWGNYHRELKIYVHTKNCKWMLIAGLLVRTKKKNWKQPKCFPMIKQTLVYHKMEHYSVIKKRMNHWYIQQPWGNS